jgi:cobalt-zinc-cadmium efflux system outer membrane protein
VIVASSATANGGEALTLQQAVRLARGGNPSVAAARDDVKAADAAVRAARALANPEIVVTPSVISEGSDEELLAVQPLEVSGRRRIRTNAASYEADAARAGSRAVERDVVRNVKQAYWQVAQAQAVVDLHRDNVRFAQSLRDAARRQAEVGTAPGSHAIKAEVELARAMQDLSSAESGLVRTKAALNVLMGREAATEFSLADGLRFSPLGAAPEVLRAAALASRPEVQEAEALLAAREADIAAARALRRPDLAVQARRETFGGDGGIGVSLVLPVFDWGSIRHQTTRARAAADAQGKRVEAARSAVMLDVEQALLDVGTAEAQVRGYQQGLLSQSERLAEMAQKGYRAGATGYLEVLEAQRTLRSVRADYYTALAAHLRALAQLEWAAGVDLSQPQEVKP